MIESSLTVGQQVPAFLLPDQDAVPVAVPIARPTVLVFFRGQW